MHAARSQVRASPTPQYSLAHSVLLGQWFLLSLSEFRNSTSVSNEFGQAPAQPPNSSAGTGSAGLDWDGLEQWAQGLHFLPNNRNQRFSPSSRSETLLQDSFPGGDGAMSCPILTKNQQSGIPFDSPVGSYCRQLGRQSYSQQALLRKFCSAQAEEYFTMVNDGNFPNGKSTFTLIQCI